MDRQLKKSRAVSKKRKRRRGREEKRRQKKVVSETEGKVQPLLVYFPLWLVFVCLFVVYLFVFVCAGGCGVRLWFLASWRRDSDKDCTGKTESE